MVGPTCISMPAYMGPYDKYSVSMRAHQTAIRAGRLHERSDTRRYARNKCGWERGRKKPTHKKHFMDVTVSVCILCTVPSVLDFRYSNILILAIAYAPFNNSNTFVVLVFAASSLLLLVSATPNPLSFDSQTLDNPEAAACAHCALLGTPHSRIHARIRGHMPCT